MEQGDVNVWRKEYAKFLRSPEWKKRRQSLFQQFDGTTCEICNSSERINVHHNNYSRKGCERDSDLVILCCECHNLFHSSSYAGEEKAKYFFEMGRWQEDFGATGCCTCSRKADFIVDATSEDRRDLPFCGHCAKLFKKKLEGVEAKTIETGIPVRFAGGFRPPSLRSHYVRRVKRGEKRRLKTS